MVMTCVAYRCTNAAKKGSKITFHMFPKDEVLRKKWVEATKKPNFIPNKNSKLCSEHFAPDAFKYSPETFNRLLKRDAVPTIFKKYPPQPRNQTKPQIAALKKSEQIVAEELAKHVLQTPSNDEQITKNTKQTQSKNSSTVLSSSSAQPEPKKRKITQVNIQVNPPDLEDDNSLAETEDILSTILQTQNNNSENKSLPIQSNPSMGRGTTKNSPFVQIFLKESLVESGSTEKSHLDQKYSLVESDTTNLTDPLMERSSTEKFPLVKADPLVENDSTGWHFLCNGTLPETPQFGASNVISAETKTSQNTCKPQPKIPLDRLHSRIQQRAKLKSDKIKPETPKPMALSSEKIQHSILEALKLKPVTPQPSNLQPTKLKAVSSKNTLKPAKAQPVVQQPTILHTASSNPVTLQPATFGPVILQTETLKPVILREETLESAKEGSTMSLLPEATLEPAKEGSTIYQATTLTPTSMQNREYVKPQPAIPRNQTFLPKFAVQRRNGSLADEHCYSKTYFKRTSTEIVLRQRIKLLQLKLRRRDKTIRRLKSLLKSRNNLLKKTKNSEENRQIEFELIEMLDDESFELEDFC